MLSATEPGILWNLLINLPKPSSETTAFCGTQNHATEESKVHLHGRQPQASLLQQPCPPRPLFSLASYQPSSLQDSWFADSWHHLVLHAVISDCPVLHAGLDNQRIIIASGAKA